MTGAVMQSSLDHKLELTIACWWVAGIQLHAIM